jgi:hypothetical protein
MPAGMACLSPVFFHYLPARHFLACPGHGGGHDVALCVAIFTQMWTESLLCGSGAARVRAARA